MGFFSYAQGQLTPQSDGQIRSNLELFQALMYVIFTCKYEKDLIKSIQENVMTPFFPL